MVNCAKAAEIATGAKLEFKEPREGRMSLFAA